jgi:hypothetical protein
MTEARPHPVDTFAFILLMSAARMREALPWGVEVANG